MRAGFALVLAPILCAAGAALSIVMRHLLMFNLQHVTRSARRGHFAPAGAANPLVHLALQAPVRRLRGGDGDDDGRRPAHPHLELKSPITYITDCKVSGMCDLTSQSPLWKMWNVHIFGLPFQWQSDDSLVLKCRTKTGRAD